MIDRVEMMREVLKYARRFISRRVVIQISSELMDSRGFPSLMRDLALIQHSGIQILLVPGAQKRIDTVLRQFNMEPEFKGEMRISAEESLPLILMASLDMANRLMADCSRHQLGSVIGNWVRARGIGVVNGCDFQMTGTVEKINIAGIEQILKDGSIPILPCIGWNSAGQAYNISSLELARCLAVDLRAEKLFFITESFFLDAQELNFAEDGAEQDAQQVSSFNIHKATTFLEQNKDLLNEADYDVIRHAVHAVSEGVERVHILNGAIDGSILLEIFSTQGSGTMIHANPLNAIRPMEPKDIGAVLHIMEPEIDRGNLLARSQEELLDVYADFVVYEVDDSIKGCGALHCYEGGKAELAALAVAPASSKLGIGNQILQHLIAQARQKNIQNIFALTTQAADWFLSMGFTRGELSDLPEERRYNNNRNSRIYCLAL